MPREVHEAKVGAFRIQSVKMLHGTCEKMEQDLASYALLSQILIESEKERADKSKHYAPRSMSLAFLSLARTQPDETERAPLLCIQLCPIRATSLFPFVNFTFP